MVRHLTHRDIPGIIWELGPTLDKLASEINFELKTNHRHMAEAWTGLLQSGVGRGYGLYVNEQAKGLLLGLIFPDSLTGHKLGHECLWAVDHSARYHAVALLEEFEHECKREGCHAVVCTATSGPSMEKMRGLYKKLGYHPVAEAFSQKL